MLVFVYGPLAFGNSAQTQSGRYVGLFNAMVGTELYRSLLSILTFFGQYQCLILSAELVPRVWDYLNQIYK